MARRGLIVAVSGMIQLEDGSIKAADFGYRHGNHRPNSNVILYSSKAASIAIAHRMIALVRMVRAGVLIGLGCVLVMRDGATERIAIGSLCGLTALLSAIQFSPIYERRRLHDRRLYDRRQESQKSNQRRQMASDQEMLL